MKKISLILTLTFCLCLFAGCQKSNKIDNVNEGNEPSEEQNLETSTETQIEENQESNGGILTALYKDGGKLTCNMETNDSTLGDIFATLYVDGDKSFTKSTFTEDGETINMYSLNRDGKTYARGDMYGEGFGLVMDAEESVETQISNYDAEDEDIKMDCVSGVEGDMFNVPSNIQFSDINNLY